MIVKGCNQFYEGWLANVLLRPLPRDCTDVYRDGWLMADETGATAIDALIAEIRRNHIVVESQSSATPRETSHHE